MKQKNIISIVLAFLVISIMGNIFIYDHVFSQGERLRGYEIKTESDSTFFKNYIIAVNDYHISSGLVDYAGINLNSGNEYSQTEGYYYEFAFDYYSEAKNQLTKSKKLLTHSKNKLEEIKNKAPSTFYTNEINNRIEQNDIMLNLTNQYFLLNDYMIKQMDAALEENDSENTKYFNMYNDLTKEINKNLQKLSDVSQKINLDWDQDWYDLL